MKKRNKRRTKRIRNLAFVCVLSAIVLTVSTYAWFIGMQSVSVSSFEIEIKSADSLLLSLNGKDWSSNVTISETTYNTASYTGNTNSWGGVGIFPMSSIGEMDTGSSRMKLYEKASLTPTTGGYRLLASRVNNYGTGQTEQDGYVAFDLFVRNFTGAKYIPELNPLDEEAIYLTIDSSASVATTGVANTGIENSVRVAFAQIGRVIGTSEDTAAITGITCTTNATTGVTGICRTAQIWEPNDKRHVDAAIDWYETSCLERTGDVVTTVASYTSNACGTVADGTAYPTYAIATDIESSDNIDIYDGAEYNKYVKEYEDDETELLVAYPFFTDTMKLLTGMQRPEFMTLAPNSITKIRVYVYIEGQDIDNYDFASIGKRIAVKFGFSKERFTEEDIGYNGPDLITGEQPVVEEQTEEPVEEPTESDGGA